MKESVLFMSERTSVESFDSLEMESRPMKDVESFDSLEMESRSVGDTVEEYGLPDASFSTSWNYEYFNKRQKTKQNHKFPSSIQEIVQNSHKNKANLLNRLEQAVDIPQAPAVPQLGGNHSEIQESRKEKMTPSELANILTKDYQFILIDENLHCYNKESGYWSCIPEKDSKTILRRLIPPKLRCYITNFTLTEIYNWLKIDCDVINKASLVQRKNYLNFMDVVYSIEEGKTMPHDKKYYFQNVLQIPYNNINPSDGKNYQYFMNSTFGEDNATIRCFEEFLGLAISPIRDVKQSFFLYGPSNTGKSVILNVLKEIVGIEFTSSLSFSQLGNEFAVAQLVGKWLNISGEMSGVANRRIDIFKSLTGNDLVTACFKGKDHFQFQNQALLVFACNNFPEISYEVVEAFASRIIMFPFSNVIPREKWIPDLSEKLLQEKDIIIKRAIKGLKRLQKRNYEFQETDSMYQCKQVFLGDSNSFLLFARRCIVENPNGQCSSSSIKKCYHEFCSRHNLQQVADNVWSKTLLELYPAQKCNITSGPEIEEGIISYNSRGYKGIILLPLVNQLE